MSVRVLNNNDFNRFGNRVVDNRTEYNNTYKNTDAHDVNFDTLQRLVVFHESLSESFGKIAWNLDMNANANVSSDAYTDIKHIRSSDMICTEEKKQKYLLWLRIVHPRNHETDEKSKANIKHMFFNCIARKNFELSQFIDKYKDMNY